MMNGQSYEQRIGLLTNTAYGSGHIPTLLGNDGTSANNYTNDHPVGQNATMLDKGGNPMQGPTATSGVVWSNNTFNYNTGTPYATFVNNYGWPAVAPGKWSNPYGLTTGGKPYVLCTTCHNQHVMTVYTSSAASPINNDGGGKWYATYFFVNGPYNPMISPDATGKTAPSTTQFCRQCHFGESNEMNNTAGIKTQFQ